MRRLSMFGGLVLILTGAFLIFMVYGFASMVDPSLPPAERNAEIWDRILDGGGMGTIGIGMLLTIAGIYLAVSKPKS